MGRSGRTAARSMRAFLLTMGRRVVSTTRRRATPRFDGRAVVSRLIEKIERCSRVVCDAQEAIRTPAEASGKATSQPTAHDSLHEQGGFLALELAETVSRSNDEGRTLSRQYAPRHMA